MSAFKKITRNSILKMTASYLERDIAKGFQEGIFSFEGNVADENADSSRYEYFCAKFITAGGNIIYYELNEKKQSATDWEEYDELIDRLQR